MTTSSTGNDLTVIGSTTRSITDQADTDGQVVALWVRSSNSSHTRRARDEDARRFLGFVGKALIGVTVGDLQSYAGELAGSDSTKSRRLNPSSPPIGAPHANLTILAANFRGSAPSRSPTPIVVP